MAKDFLSVITPSADLTVADVAGNGPGAGTDLSTGDIRRKYNFGDRVSELNIAQDPFFRFLSKVAKKPVDDPQFKWTEKRPSSHKRYAYVSNHGTTAPTALAGGDATVTHGNVDAGDTYYFCMIGDWENAGNIQTVYGNTSTDVVPGASGTQPAFFIPGQLVRIPYSTSVTAGSWDDSSASEASKPDSYLVARVETVDLDSVSNAAILKCVIADKGTAAADFELVSYSAYNNALDAIDISSFSIADYLEPKRSYVIGTAFKEGTGYPETWKDQPYVSNYGLTQIWKTSMAMTNSARATSLKFDSNEWARVWKEKLIEHKWDLETSLLFGAQYNDTTNGYQYTQGAADYISTYGNQFSLTIATKTADDFLDDMSNYVDPRYNQSSATLFFCSTAVYNWLHKLGGYFKNNLEISSNFRSDLALTGKKKVFGVDISTFSTPYGDMHVARNIHLDTTNIKLLGVNMKNCAWRPLVGNGINRDTSVYVGVQTLENSGVDRRVDLILTEGGMEWQMPESHAIWT